MEQKSDLANRQVDDEPLDSKVNSKYIIGFRAAAEDGQSGDIPVPEAMAGEGAVVSKMLQYALGKEVVVGEHNYSQQLDREGQAFAAALKREMEPQKGGKNRDYDLLLMHVPGVRSFHGDDVTFQTHGRVVEHGVTRLDVIVVGGREWGGGTVRNNDYRDNTE